MSKTSLVARNSLLNLWWNTPEDEIRLGGGLREAILFEELFVEIADEGKLPDWAIDVAFINSSQRERLVCVCIASE